MNFFLAYNRRIRRSQQHRLANSSAGFTLIEVLVAIAVVAFTIPALMLLMMKQADNAATLRNKMVAAWIAENTLTRLRLERQLNNSALTSPREDKIEMAGAEWFVLTEPQSTQLALLQYRTTVGVEQDKPLVTIETYVH